MLKHENCYLLKRSIDIIEAVTDSQYTLADQSLFKSSMGTHIRHILDHYQALIDGLPLGHIDYDARARQASVELNRHIAIEKLNQTIASIEQLDNYEMSLLVSMDVGSRDAVNNLPQRSTLGRELTFLHSHHIHHEALIAFILRVLDLSAVVNDIGLAPSTKNYEAKHSGDGLNKQANDSITKNREAL